MDRSAAHPGLARTPRHVVVVDIGKTNAKLALVDLQARSEVAVRKAPNVPLRDGPYPHHDVDAIWAFLLGGLRELASAHPVDALIVTTHGATAALVGSDGELALPVLDYEHDGPDSLRAEYDAVRPDFAETGSPRLPGGLNVGAQLHWQAREFPDAFARTARILMYPQYWAERLCGVAATEVTSLGAHTDLWNPHAKDFSTLVDAQAWRGLFPPIRPAGARLAALLPAVAAATGIDPATPVYCGLHDSNASLLPHLSARKAPFAVVSTGTWVIVMAVGASPAALDPDRDTLINVNAFGEPVPSARFMGGREFALLTDGHLDWTDADVDQILSDPVWLMPSVVADCGPFPGRGAFWTGAEPIGGCRVVAASFYLAMMTATSLALAGAAGPIVVEGAFAANPLYCRMLAAATGRPVLPQANATGTSIGAALLVAAGPMGKSAPESPVEAPDGRWRDYAREWRRLADRPASGMPAFSSRDA